MGYYLSYYLVERKLKFHVICFINCFSYSYSDFTKCNITKCILKQCEKQPTGPLDRKKLLDYINDQALNTPDIPDVVPHIPGTIRGKKVKKMNFKDLI